MIRYAQNYRNKMELSFDRHFMSKILQPHVLVTCVWVEHCKRHVEATTDLKIPINGSYKNMDQINEFCA